MTYFIGGNLDKPTPYAVCGYRNDNGHCCISIMGHDKGKPETVFHMCACKQPFIGQFTFTATVYCDWEPIDLGVMEPLYVSTVSRQPDIYDRLFARYTPVVAQPSLTKIVNPY